MPFWGGRPSHYVKGKAPRSHIPYLFDGILPDFNLGTNSGTSCNSELENGIVKICKSSSDHSSVLNGRFKGGFITREYGQPEQHIHAVQLELA
ncbi:N-formylglutamate amidohydrolase [uncultured Tolumonas sp.]|uniref:N-formylglutamate amidohydrolase n=1 Tax=uncultured Tolumonas sp. TaxID=263765 RepID=UPI00374A3BCC